MRSHWCFGAYKTRTLKRWSTRPPKVYYESLPQRRFLMYHRVTARASPKREDKPETGGPWKLNKQPPGTSRQWYFRNSRPGHKEGGAAERPMERCKSAARRFPTLPGASRTNRGGNQTRFQPTAQECRIPDGGLLHTYKRRKIYEP